VDPGQACPLTPFAERLLWAERQARVRMTPHVEALRRELQRVFALADDASQDVLELAASHDLALPTLQTLAEAERGLHLAVRFAGSEEALRSLLDGRCGVAGFHVPRLAQAAPLFSRALRPLLKPGTHKLIGSHWRRQGPDAPTDSAPPRLVDLLQSPAPASPDCASSTASPARARGCCSTTCWPGRARSAAIEGYASRVEYTHLAVATAVASGDADVGLGIEAAAQRPRPGVRAAGGRGLLPRLPEADARVAADRRVALGARLAAWAARCETCRLRPQRPGEVLSLTQALPWWRFARPKTR
jgi:hypothetical protein